MFQAAAMVSELAEFGVGPRWYDHVLKASLRCHVLTCFQDVQKDEHDFQTLAKFAHHGAGLNESQHLPLSKITQFWR